MKWMFYLPSQFGPIGHYLSSGLSAKPLASQQVGTGEMRRFQTESVSLSRGFGVDFGSLATVY